MFSSGPGEVDVVCVPGVGRAGLGTGIAAIFFLISYEVFIKGIVHIIILSLLPLMLFQNLPVGLSFFH